MKKLLFIFWAAICIARAEEEGTPFVATVVFENQTDYDIDTYFDGQTALVPAGESTVLNLTVSNPGVAFLLFGNEITGLAYGEDNFETDIGIIRYTLTPRPPDLFQIDYVRSVDP